VAGGILLLLAVIFAPHGGVVARAWRRRALGRRIEDEDALAALWRAAETGGAPPRIAAGIRNRLARAGLVRDGAQTPALTAAGSNKAAQLVRSHRLWETYLGRETALPQDHLHLSAHRLEHATAPELAQALAQALGHAAHDPHGKRIPPGA
jgi:manganese/zinc/iron transport system permease protein